MAGDFSIFTQPQGAPIDVSLFGQAAQTGAQIGKEIPNPITSLIQGAEQGYQYGQQAVINNQTIAANTQQQQLRQNQIDNIPLTNQALTQQVQSAGLALKLQTQNTQDQLDNNDLSNSNTTAQLNQQIAANTQKTNLIGQYNDFVKNWPAWGQQPGQQEYNLLGPTYAGLFATPEGKNLQNLFLNSSDTNTFSPQGQIEVQRLRANNQATQAQQATYQKDLGDTNNAFGKIENSTAANDGFSNLNLPKQFILQNTTPVLTGDDGESKYLTDDSGHVLADPDTGEKS